MRHRVHGRKLGRTSSHRKALFRNQLTALFTHERIITTVPKAKELRPIAERMVTLARTGTLAARRRVGAMISDKEIARRLFDEIAPRFADRPGGYTRIMRLGRRHGDNAELAIIEFIDYELADHQDDGETKAKGSFLDRAKGMFGSGAAAEAEDGTVEATEAVDETAEPTAETAADAQETTEEPVEAESVEVVEEPVEAAPVADEPAETVEAAPVEETPAVEATSDDADVAVEDDENKTT